MINEVFMPHAEAYYDGENGFNLAFCCEPGKNVENDTDELGKALIDFVELYLNEYTEKLIALAGHPITKETINTLSITDFRNDVVVLLEYAETLHPYVNFFLHIAINEGLALFDTATADESNEQEIKMIVNGFIKAFYDVKICYDTFYNALTSCFNKNNEDTKEMEIGNKFWFFADQYPQYNNFTLHTTYKLIPSANGKIKFGRLEFGLPEETENEINDIFQGNFIYTNVFLLYTLEEMLYFEFCHMLNNGIAMRVCRNCNRLYLVKGNYDTKYCNRVNDKGISCSSRGAKKHFMNNLDKDKYLKEYDRAYQRLYAKLTRKTMSGADFDKWTKTAAESRKKYKAGEISGEQLLGYLEFPQIPNKKPAGI